MMIDNAQPKYRIVNKDNGIRWHEAAPERDCANCRFTHDEHIDGKCPFEAAPEITDAAVERVAKVKVNPDVDGLIGPCKNCGKTPVEWDYLVSDEYWQSHVPVDVRLGVVCLPCLEGMTKGVPLNEFKVFYYTNAEGTLPLVPYTETTDVMVERAAKAIRETRCNRPIVSDREVACAALTAALEARKEGD